MERTSARRGTGKRGAGPSAAVAAAAALALILPACGAPGAGEQGDTLDPSALAEVSALEVPATDGDLSLPFDLAVEGWTGGGVRASLRHGVGTIAFPGAAEPAAAFVYERQPWPEMGFTLYQALAVTPERWRVVWFYCSGSSLIWVDHEATDDPALREEPGSGSCVEAAAPVRERVQLPASRLAVASAARPFEVRGRALDLPPAGAGKMSVGGSSWSVQPFAVVDCSACGKGGWQELHAIFREEAGARTCFGIFYLLESAPRTVPLEYARCLPDLGDPLDGTAWFDAGWAPAAASAAAPVQAT